MRTKSASGGSPYLNPNDSTVTRSPRESSPPNSSSTRLRSWLTLRWVVSISTSACPRASTSSSRSAPIPSESRPSPCNGCGRRTLSNRRINTSVSASTNTTRGEKPWSRNACTAPVRSVEKARLRTSSTMAVLRAIPPALYASSAMSSIRAWGRLSTT